jgi:hypothetical protein
MASRSHSAPIGLSLRSIRCLGIYAAVTRATLDGKNHGGWIPEEKITLTEAIEAYTMGAAFAEFQENEKGLDYTRQARGHGHLD